MEFTAEQLKEAAAQLKAQRAEAKQDVMERRHEAVKAGIKPQLITFAENQALTLKPIKFQSGNLGLDAYGRVVLDGQAYNVTVRLVKQG